MRKVPWAIFYEALLFYGIPSFVASVSGMHSITCAFSKYRPHAGPVTTPYATASIYRPSNSQRWTYYLTLKDEIHVMHGF